MASTTTTATTTTTTTIASTIVENLASTEKRSIAAADYIVFLGTLAVSLSIGFYHAFCKRKKSNAEYLVGSRTMTLLPVSLSLMATTLSGISILGYPAEIYAYGTIMTEAAFSAIVWVPLLCLTFLPTFYNIEITSVFDYFELRFQSRFLKYLSTSLYLITLVLYVGVVLYAPSLALSAVVDFPIWASILLIGGCVTTYTTLGGFQAVVWSEAFQASIMMIGLLSILIKGAMNVGGIGGALEIAKEHNRHRFLDFKFAPLERHTTLNIFFGQGVYWGSLYGTGIGQVNRFRSLKSYTEMKKTIVSSTIILATCALLVCLCGLVIFANYAGCDPLKLGLIDRADQALPFFVDDQLTVIPGLMGLFFAALFSGTLGACSGSINAIATAVWRDYMRKTSYFKNPSEVREKYTLKIVTLVAGLCGVAFAFVAGSLGNVLQASMLVFGALTTPLAATLALGMLFPFSNKKGAIVGLLTSQVLLVWIAVGAVIYRPSMAPLPSSVDYCYTKNLTESFTRSMATVNWTQVHHVEPPVILEWPEKIYSLSYLMYTVIGWIVTISLGVIVSLATGGHHQTIGELGLLVNPAIRKLYRHLGKYDEDAVAAHEKTKPSIEMTKYPSDEKYSKEEAAKMI